MMNAKRTVAVFVAALLAAASVPARAAFQEPISSPESAAQANASLTSSRDSSSLFVNPAQLAGMTRGDFYFMHNQMYAGMQGVGSIGQGFISAAMPTRFGSFGFGLGMFRAAGLLEERTLALTYAKSIGRFAFGVTGKQLHHGYLIGDDPLAAKDPVFKDGRSSSAMALDFGVTAQATERLRLGAAVRNFNNPDVGLATSDRVPREIQAGAAYQLRQRGLRVTADVTYRDAEAGTTRERLTPAIGLEKTMSDGKFAFRFGLTPDDITAGFGLKFGVVGLDYALVLRRQLIEGSVGTHMIGLRLRFGGGAEQRVVNARKDLEEAPAPTIARAPDQTASQERLSLHD